MALTMSSGVNAAGNVLELPTTQSGKLETIGTVPPKRFIDLDLGKLRTRDARLPGGMLTVKDRERLRARQAIERQEAVSEARRPPEPARYVNDEIQQRARDQLLE